MLNNYDNDLIESASCHMTNILGGQLSDYDRRELAEKEEALGSGLEKLNSEICHLISIYASEHLCEYLEEKDQIEIEDSVRDLIVNQALETPIHNMAKECENLGNDDPIWKSRLQVSSEILTPRYTHEKLKEMGV